MLNQIQQEILSGLMLGDGHLSKMGKNAQLEITRAIKDKNYILYHKKIFEQFLTPKAIYEKNTFDTRTNKTYSSIRLRTRALPEFTKYHDLWYQNRIKIIPKNLVLTPTIIATWLADDGTVYLHSKYGKVYKDEIRMQFATNGFTKEEVISLRNLLQERYNCNFGMYESNKNYQYVLMITKRQDIQNIFRDIDKSFPEGMDRKSDFWRKTNYLDIK